ncbi:hypothetical protein PF010_g19458 [Phytophthora fragariae]|uniref:Protein kinase domain-containing protein n=1 Tax=Phytophthora fragariae TaxID=53985 RepID=A0A6A3SNU0_9STRA|nr:hypothetical protein PF003_g11741 [Phytophthora fragariae]KAE8989201.1 hypothetical protein PF011_g18866 [Phytophthora fragariae]KAE9088177.1 hypothetical protein PF010_g19458 [Phytophthora fragariae]KAE9117354.1 hypothetical protein PF006_g18828 [Phytophthora fragariae]
MDVIETDRADVQVNSAGAISYVNSYKIMQMLGEGTFSKVYLCQNEAGDEFALKVINKSILKRKREYKRVDGKLVLSNAFQKVQKEVAIMKKLAHPNLVRLYEVIDSPADDKLFLVLELIRGGQIMYWDDKKFRYFARNKSTGVLGKDAVRECLRDVVAALAFLHRNHICHRDIKPENILLSGDQFKLADFGVAYMNEDAPAVAAKPEDASLRLRSTEGTYHFLAPECTTGDEYDPYQVDVWALGVTMFTLLVGTLPFGTSVASLSDVMTSIREDALILPPDLDPECAELLTLLMEKNPRLRITIPQLKTHPWVSRAGGELDRRSSGLEVMVTQQEIEAAFTPVNNFILVMKLKMKMSSRLNNARKSLASSPNSKRQVEAVPVTKHVPVSSSQLTADKSDGGNERTLPKTMEMAPSEQPRAMNDRLQRRSSRLVESISETVGSLTATMTRRKSQIGAISPIFDSAATIASSPVPGEGSPGKSDASGRPGVLLRTMSRRNSSLIPDISQRTDSAKAPGTLYPGKGDGEAEETSTSKAEEAKILAYRLTKRKSTSLRGFSRIIETPEARAASPSSSNSDTATSPRMSSPNSPLGTLKTKVSPFAMQSEDQALQPIRKAKLPVLDMHLSPISSPVTSPAASPRKTGASGDVETTVESTPRRRSSSPSKTIGFEGRALLKASPLSRKRSSSLTLDGFSSSSDEGEKQSESHPDNIVKSVSPTTRPTLEDPVSPKPRRRATVSNVPTSPLPDPDKRPQSPVEGDDPDSVLTRKSSLQKVLDACLTADRAADRNVDTVASPLEATETPVKPPTPTRRHQVQVPPLVRPPVDHPLDSSLSHGRHHQIAPLASIEKPMRIEAAVESDSKSPSRTRRRSIVQAQDSLRVLFGGKSSIRLSMLEEKRDANHPNVTPDKISTIKSKVCGIM